MASWLFDFSGTNCRTNIILHAQLFFFFKLRRSRPQQAGRARRTHSVTSRSVPSGTHPCSCVFLLGFGCGFESSVVCRLSSCKKCACVKYILPASRGERRFHVHVSGSVRGGASRQRRKVVGACGTCFEMVVPRSLDVLMCDVGNGNVCSELEKEPACRGLHIRP